MMSDFITVGADVNAKDKEGTNSLMAAAARGWRSSNRSSLPREST